MNIFESLKFSDPIFLIGIVFIGAFYVYLMLYRQKKQNLQNIELLKKVYQRSSYWYRIHDISVLCISILFCMYLSGPYLQNTYETVKREGIDIEIVLDVSYSMIATDILPSRIEVAKSGFVEFISGLESDRVGLILFSGKPFQSVPLSYDYDFLADFVSETSVEIIDQSNPRLQGTAIGDALLLASDVLSDDTQREKVIILITDGEANKGIDPSLALKLLKEKGIKTYTIGVGKDDVTTIRAEVAPGFFQNIEIGGLDEEILTRIASETGGEYYRADSRTAFTQILERISELEKKELEIEQRVLNYSLNHVVALFLVFCLFFLSFCIFIKNTRHA